MIGFVKAGYPTNKRPGRSRLDSNHPTVSVDVKRQVFSDGRREVVSSSARKTAPICCRSQSETTTPCKMWSRWVQLLPLSRGWVWDTTTWKIVCSSHLMDS